GSPQPAHDQGLPTGRATQIAQDALGHDLARQRSRIVGPLEISGRDEDSRRIDLVVREEARAAAADRLVAAGKTEPRHAHPLGQMLGTIPALVLGFPRPIAIVPDGKNAGLVLLVPWRCPRPRHYRASTISQELRLFHVGTP